MSSNPIELLFFENIDVFFLINLRLPLSNDLGSGI